MTATVQTRGLSKWFGESMALNNVELAIEPGVTGLLGPNGAGKSTFMKLALGVYRPSCGTVCVLGESPRNNLAVLRRVGYCPESEALPDAMTGHEFVYWLNRFWGMARKDARRAADEACALVGMAGRMHDPMAEYSRGMRQRIKIAQALATVPKVLFLDEPLSGLDPRGRDEMFALIRTLGEAGRTVVMSSHVLYEIERVTNEVVLFHNGCILARGPVGHIRELIAEHPDTVTVECPRPRALAARFMDDETTLGLEFRDGAFTIRTVNADAFFRKLNGLVLEQDVPVTRIDCVDDNLQSVFDYLVK